jgi:hypothetical protein
MTGLDKVNLSRLSYVIYEHSDLAKFEEFSKDFGFEPAGKSDTGDVLLRGYGPDPFIYIARQAAAGQGKKFCGAGFIARTSEDFDRASKLDGAQTTTVSECYGGGKMVSVLDPNGYVVQVVHGQEDQTTPSRGVSNVYDGQPNVNGAITKARKGKTMKLGWFPQFSAV